MTTHQPAGTSVLINKPTIIDGEWHEVPTVVRIQSGRIVAERMPIRDQIKFAAQCLALFIAAGPALFMAADWLRYGA